MWNLRGVVVLVAAIGAVAGGTREEIRWETRLDRAVTLSRQTNKPVLIEFWATWCTVCKGMDEEVYSDGAVANAMNNLLPVRVDIDREPAIARKYGVTETPTLVVTDGYGNELFRFKGGLPKTRLLELLRELPSDIGRINDLSASIGAAPGNFDTIDALARELSTSALYVASNRYYERALRTADAQRDAGLRGAVLVAIGRNYSALKAFDEAARSFERARHDLRGRPAEPDALLDLARAQIAQGRTRDARRTLEDVTERFKSTPAAAEAARLAATLAGR
jgi:thioredoxin-like negative regulator of GroEL